MLNLTDAQLQEFQESLRWRTGERLPDSRTLGVAGKRGKLASGNDFRVRAVARRFATADKVVLELGSCEGILTVQLAKACRHVIAVEVQPSNIVCALARQFVHDVHNVTLRLGDARDIGAGFARPVDVVFHAGLLYHLSDPVTHVYNLASLADRLLLCTHYFTPGQREGQRETLAHDGRSYQTVRFGEAAPDYMHAGFTGVESFSRWLLRDDLFRLLTDAGFDCHHVLKDPVERNGARISLLAWKSRVADTVAPA